jgi:hypothetical protein
VPYSESIGGYSLSLRQLQSFCDGTVLPQSDQIIQEYEEALVPITTMVREHLWGQINSCDFEPLDIVLYYMTPSLRRSMLRFFSNESQQRLQDLVHESQQLVIDRWLWALIDCLVQGDRSIRAMVYENGYRPIL